MTKSCSTMIVTPVENRPAHEFLHSIADWKEITPNIDLEPEVVRLCLSFVLQRSRKWRQKHQHSVRCSNVESGQSLKMILNSSDSTKKKCFGNTSMSKAFFLHRILQCSLCFVSTSLLVHCSQCLLMLAGDVEQNPGPRLSRDAKPDLRQLQFMSYTNQDEDKVFRLMEHVKPRLNRVAIALGFPPHSIDAIEKQSDPVYILFKEWLAGCNQDHDSRPLNWDTLITALMEAGLLQEAKILEKHFFAPQNKKRRYKDVESDEDLEIVSRKDVFPEHKKIAHGPVEVSVKHGSDVAERLLYLMESYADMLLVLRTTDLTVEKFRRLKLYLSDLCSEKSIRKCSTLDEVIDLLQEDLKIYYFNIDTLNIICDRFFSDEVKTSLKQYKEQLSHFLSNTSILELIGTLKTKIVDSRKVETVTVKLNETRIYDTLEVFETRIYETLEVLRKLIYFIFGIHYKVFILCGTHQGCVRITWIVPASLVPILREKAEQLSPECLASKGVLELVIGLRISPSEAILSDHDSEITKSAVQFENFSKKRESKSPVSSFEQQSSIVLPQQSHVASRYTDQASNSSQSLDSQVSQSAPEQQADMHSKDAALLLTKENYKRKFTALLYLEEAAHEQLLKNKCNGNYQLHVDCVPHEYISGMTGDQMMYAAQASECVYICDPSSEQRVAKAEIPLGKNFNKLSDKLLLNFAESEAYKLESYFEMQEKLYVSAQFEIKHYYFDLLRRSLASLSDEALERIMPLEDDEDTDKLVLTHNIPTSTYKTMELDKYQFRALQLIQSSQSRAPVLISGPFGTGKTRVLAVAAYNFIETANINDSIARVLVCCHQQVFADTYVESYFGDMLTNKQKPWRGVELVRLTRKRYRSNGDIDYQQFYVPIDEFRHEFEDFYSNSKRMIVVTTFSTALNIGSLLGADFFTHILLDEGAQVREPEAVAPLCMANRDTKIVIAGDPQQVGPTLLVLGDEPQEFGLGVSLFERLLKAYVGKLAKFIAHLPMNHRCHKDILELPSKLFYGSSLIPMSSAGTVFDAPYPLLFLCSSTAGPCEILVDTSEDEAEVLINHFRWLSKKGDTRTFQRNTCFMASSRRQVTVLKNCLTKQESSQVQFIPSYEIQGREFKALFISTVECIQDGFQSANPTKSFCNRYVFNTALTTAQSLIVCAGNPFLLLKVEAAMANPVGCWREYLRRCIEQETFIVPPDVGNRDDVVTNVRQLLDKDELQITLSSRISARGAASYQKKYDISKVSIALSSSSSSVVDEPQLLSKKTKKRKKKKNKPDQSNSTSLVSHTLAPASMPSIPSTPISGTGSVLHAAQRPIPGSGKVPKTKHHSGQHKTHLASHPHKKPLFYSDLLFPNTSEASPQTTTHQAPYDGQKTSQNLIDGFREFRHDHRSPDLEIFEGKLKAENYRERFHQLLCREEDEHKRLLEEICKKNDYLLTMKAEQTDDYEDIRYGYITAIHLNGDKIAYIEQACEKGNLIISYNGTDYRAAMHRPNYRKESLQICMPKQNALQLKDSLRKFWIHVKVTFRLKYSYFDRLHRAINLLSERTIERLLPTDPRFFSTSRFDHNLPLGEEYHEYLTLEPGQREAMKMIVHAKPEAPVIVAGSFGTGKTRILAQAAFQILKRKRTRVLVCAHHQASANSFLTQYFGPLKEKNMLQVNIARMIDTDRITDVKEEYHQYCKSIDDVAEAFEEIQLVISTFGITIHLTKQLKRLKKFYYHQFTHILIDEGAQTREPESIIPLSLCGPRTVIAIAGDHKQVGPAILVLGKEPIKYGLKISLLERLHSLYDDQPSMNHRATLITNYRCHRSLLALPSYLFYNSALITNNEPEKQTHLHPDTTFSLRFICSSLQEEFKNIDEVQQGTNVKEINFLLHAATKYVQNWPLEQWGEKDLSKVCLMTTNANQQHLMLNELMRNPNFGCLIDSTDETSRVEVRKAYEIQGLEFQCVFLSTAESITAGPELVNPTKTPCNQYVFNTILTRAQSLVVCVGNPFLLMKLESNVGNPDKKSCWREYIKRCMENETFETPSSLWENEKDRLNKMNLLTKLIYKPVSHQTVSPSTKTLDSITQAYNTFFEKLPSLEHCRLQLDSVTDGSLCWTINEIDGSVQHQHEEPHESSVKKSLKCYLEIENQNRAIGHPLDLTQPVILNGLKNWKGALNDDLVEVELYDTSRDVRYGKVVKVLKPYHQKRYVCRMDRHMKTKTMFFDPIDKKTPRLVNLPKISRDLMNLRKTDIKEGVVSQRQWVVIFEEDSLPHVIEGNNELPKIKEIITAESARDLLFVVRVIGWEPDHLLPLGAVIESLPLGTSLFHAERILRVTYDIHTDNLDEEPEKEIGEDEDESLPPGVLRQAFTIDPSDAIVLDDALSLVRENDGRYTMAVLISNVANHLELGSPSDKRALSRATSIYGAFSRDMLPATVCQRLSLNPKKLRDVIVVSTKVDKDSLKFTDEEIKQGKMESQVQLDYLEAQCILSKESCSESLQKKLIQYLSCCSRGQPDLSESLHLLYKVAMYLRVQRLGQAAYAYNIAEEENMKSWQSHLLVEELMIWANKTVAKFVHDHSKTSGTVLLRQPCPDEQELGKLNANVLQHSVAMSKLSISKAQKETPPLLVPNSTFLELQNAFKSENMLKLQCLLTSDRLYPQLASAIGHLAKVSKKAEYVSSKVYAKGSNPFYHQDLQCAFYTHFTSPIRRYCDIIMQRLLLSILNKDKCYTAEKLTELCKDLNILSRRVKQFVKDVKQVEFALQFRETSVEVSAFVNQDKNIFEVTFPDLKYSSCLKRKSSTFHMSALTCRKELDTDDIEWTAFMYYFNGNDAILHNPQFCNMSEGISDTEVSMTVFQVPGDKTTLKMPDFPLKRKHKETKGQFEDKLQAFSLSLMPKQGTILVDGMKWQSVIKNISCLSDDTFQPLLADLLKNKVQPQSQVHDIQTNSSRFRNSPIVKYEVTSKFGSNSITRVWLGQTLRKEPIMSSSLQLIEVAPELRICLQHNEHPAECFSDTEFFEASKPTYASLDEYVSLWEKVFLAEVAQDSVLAQDQHLIILKEVDLKWPTLTIPDNSTGNYYLPQGPVKLTIQPKCREFIRYNMLINPGDLVCIRYDVRREQCKAVYHLVVKEVYEQGSKKVSEEDETLALVVEMGHIGKTSCVVSPKMAEILSSPTYTCELQVINIQHSSSRVYKQLMSLKEDKEGYITEEDTEGYTVLNQLVHQVALGEIQTTMISSMKEKALQVLSSDKLAQELWTADRIQLNRRQKEAIEKAVTNCFQLIQGPPGTGKSETGAHIAYVFAQLNRDSDQCVVYCAPSNKAVDVIHEKLLQGNERIAERKGKELKLLRLYGKVHERSDFKGPDGYVVSDEEPKVCQDRFKPHALHYLIREDCPELKEMEDKFKNMKKDEVPAPKLVRRYIKLIKRREKCIILQNHDIILATCNECAGKRLSHLKDSSRVAQLIIDECAMAHEPETIAAISLSNHVVLIGDHKQLQPVIKYRPARDYGLGTSLFQRYAEKCKSRPLITLVEQYRMHEIICKFPSDHFYNKKLRAAESVENRPPVAELEDFWQAKAHPIIFCDVVKDEREYYSLTEDDTGIDDITLEKLKKEIKKSNKVRRERKTDFHSKFNPGQATITVQMATILRTKLRKRNVTIAVITPYREQKDWIVSEMPKNLKIKVLTINECQGDEYDYVILSTVRSLPLEEIEDHRLVEADSRLWKSEKLGFLADYHLINVAITRAKQGLIIIGNSTLLKYDEKTWGPLIKLYEEKECLVDGEKFIKEQQIALH